MNIFYLSHSPVESAQWMVDRHVVKMILESAQLLSTAHRYLDGVEFVGKSKTGRKKTSWVLKDERETVLYEATHINHPSAVWVRKSVENYLWLVEHFHALGKEYTYRYGKTHKCFTSNLSYMLSSPPNNLREYNMTLMPSAMADEYKIGISPIENYRNYYKNGKKHLHSWKNRQPPDWIS